MLHRFLFILLGPLGKGPQYHEIGRSIATLMTDEVRPKYKKYCSNDTSRFEGVSRMSNTQDVLKSIEK